MKLLDKIQHYWNHRNVGYSKVNQKELEGVQRENWKQVFRKELPQNDDIQILDIGTGPGFFPIILSELGYTSITAVDYSSKMLERAKENAATYVPENTICWQQMDAQQLSFEDAQFDIIVTRNLTWNLEHPDQAYQEWLRVLKPGGILLVFDANWYAYLSDKAVEEAFIRNRKQAVEEKLEDFWEAEGVDEQAMEAIVRELPLTVKQRPKWDVDYFSTIEGVSVAVDLDFGDRVWDREEQLNYAATPMFFIKVKKEDIQ